MLISLVITMSSAWADWQARFDIATRKKAVKRFGALEAAFDCSSTQFKTYSGGVFSYEDAAADNLANIGKEELA